MSSQLLGKKGAIYSLPKKLDVTACPGWRLRSGPEIPARLRGGWIIGADRTFRSRGPETPDTLRGCSGPLSSTAPQRCKGQRKSLRPEIPGPLGWRLRTISGVPPDPNTVPHHKMNTGRRKTQDRSVRVLWAGESGGTGDSGPSLG